MLSEDYQKLNGGGDDDDVLRHGLLHVSGHALLTVDCLHYDDQTPY